MTESYFNEVTDLTWRFATLLKRNSNTGAFLLIFRNFFRKRPAGVSEYSVLLSRKVSNAFKATACCGKSSSQILINITIYFLDAIKPGMV